MLGNKGTVPGLLTGTEANLVPPVHGQQLLLLAQRIVALLTSQKAHTSFSRECTSCRGQHPRSGCTLTPHCTSLSRLL